MANEDSIWKTKNEYANQGQYIRASSGTGQYPGRWVVENGTRRWHTGEGLVTANEDYVRDSSGAIKVAYNLDVEPGMYLASLTPSQRVHQMKLLANAGFIDPGSIGDYAAEMRAITNAMETANFAGLEWGYAIQQRLSGGPVKISGGGGTRTYQKTAPEDLKKVGNKIALQTLGREFTQEEADRFVQAYQQQEVGAQRAAYGGGVMQQAPAIDVAAETFAEQTAPKEAGAYEYLNYMNKLFGMIGVG